MTPEQADGVMRLAVMGYLGFVFIAVAIVMDWLESR